VDVSAQAFNIALTLLPLISTVAGALAGALSGSLTRQVIWEEISNSSFASTAIQLDPIADACKRMKFAHSLNSTDSDIRWQGIDTIRANFVPITVLLSDTRCEKVFKGWRDKFCPKI